MQTVVVVDYDPKWPTVFEQLRDHIWPVVRDVALSIEHIGSTSVPGLAAKPIIDLSIVVPSDAEVPLAVERLATLSYAHRGNLGIEGREAFKRPDGWPRHNLYLCPKDSLGLKNPLAVRDYLRVHSDRAQAYGALKKQLAAQCPDDIDRYVEGKTDFILDILQKQGFSSVQRAAIEQVNRIQD